jgi:hypothetical protein
VSRTRTIAATVGVLLTAWLLPVAAVAQEGTDSPLDALTTTDPWSGGQTADAALTVTEVRVSVHEGFDRVLFVTEGEGEAGWSVKYGLPIRVAAAVSLRVTLKGIAPAAERPAGTDTFDDDVAGAADGVVAEVVSDVVLDGQHTFFVGLPERLPYRVIRIAGPKGIAIDVLHGSGPEAAPDEPEVVPTGGVETGWGGLAADPPIGAATALGGVLLVASGVGLRLRRRTTP